MKKEQLIDMRKVEKLMRQHGYTVKTFAEAIGVSPKTLKKYLNGADQSRMSSRYLIKFATALHTSAAHLLKEN